MLISIVCVLFSGTALSHDPDQHGFRLVTFDRSVNAPPFTLKGLTGDTVELEQFQGEIVVLNFWATWCPPCLKEMPSMEQLQLNFAGNPFRVVAISLDKESRHVVQSFVSKLNITFPILLDPEGIAANPYGAKDLPTTFILNKENLVIAAAKGERDWYSQGAISYITELLEH